jgi:hypothetical protein
LEVRHDPSPTYRGGDEGEVGAALPKAIRSWLWPPCSNLVPMTPSLKVNRRALAALIAARRAPEPERSDR